MNSYDTNPIHKPLPDDMGLGYRNVCWLPAYSKNGMSGVGKMKLFGYDKAGSPKTFTVPFYPSVKYEVKHHTPEKDLYGRCIATKWFENTQDRDAWCRAMDGKAKIISCYPPEQEFLLNTFGKHVFDEGFNQQAERIHYLDIEVAIENEFPEPELAKYPINIITVYDTFRSGFISWALDTSVENTLDGMNIELRKFATEEELLKDYLLWHSENYPDVVSGWNTRAFDMIYIVRRLENVLGKDNARMYSPVRKYTFKIDKKRYNKKFVAVRGISNLDLMFLYRDKFAIKQALDGGYSLNNVSLVELDDAKVHYDGSMLDFYKGNFQRFWEYNIQDVNLVVKLDEKLKLTQIARKITSFGCSQQEAIYTTISYIVSSLDIFARNNFGKTFLSYINMDSRGADADQYEGAFVFPTQVGIYKQGIVGVDINSLYPSSSMVLNLSPETLVGVVSKDLESDGRYVINFASGQKKSVSSEELEEILNTKCTIARNNALFIKHEVKEGIFANWCRHFFKLRKTFKKKLEAAEKEMSDMEKSGNADAVRSKELELVAEIADTTQYALKILINSAYGTLGTTYSPLYDTRLAEAITLTGQFANRSTAAYLNEIFKKEFGVPENENITISGDTDSVTGDTDIEVEFDESAV